MVLTFCIAVTTKSEKKSLSEERSFEDIEVLAALMRASFPRVSTGMLRLVWMNLTDSLRASLYPDIMEVG